MDARVRLGPQPKGAKRLAVGRWSGFRGEERFQDVDIDRFIWERDETLHWETEMSNLVDGMGVDG